MTETNELVRAWREMGPVAWCESAYGWIGEDGRPIRLEPWQKAVLSAWEAHSGEISTLAVSNVKKTGKTLLNGLLLAWRWLALPGQHFAVGNDLDQAAARSFGMIADMVRRHPYLVQVVKAGKNELVFEPTGSRLTALAVDAAGNAGANHLTVSHTEAWGIIYEAGIRAYEELTPPPGRFYGLPCLRIADSYAGYLNESKTWHTLVDRGLGGERLRGEWPIYKAGGLLLFHMEGEEGRERCFRGTPEEAEAYYQEQRESLRPTAFTRMHGNQRTASESQFLPEGAWAGCYSPELRPYQPGERRRLVIGADASTSRDFTALVGVEYNQRTQTIDVARVRVWKPRRGLFRGGKPTVDLEETLGAEIIELHQAKVLHAVVYDPYQLHSLAIGWQKAGIRCIELPQTTARTEADQALYDLVISGGIRHYNDRNLNEHIQNAVAVESQRGFRLAKEKTSAKIDAAVALSMAVWGGLKMKAAGGGDLVITDNPFYGDGAALPEGYDPEVGGIWTSFNSVPPERYIDHAYEQEKARAESVVDMMWKLIQEKRKGA